VIILFVARRED